MKYKHTLLASLCLAPALLFPAVGFSAAEVAVRDLPGYVDLGAFAPASSGGEFVEINLGRPLLRFAAKVTAAQEPMVSELLNELHSLRVNVMAIDHSNQTQLTSRAEEIRGRLESAGWEKVVSVREADENVNIFARTAGEDVIQGLTIMVLGRDKEAVFINIVGNVRPDQVATLAERFDIEPLKHLGHRKQS